MMMDRNWWSHLAVLYLLLLYLGQAADICHRGMRLYTPFKGPDVCLWCDSGTFMPEELHTQRKCYPCATIQNPELEKVASPCNGTHDTEIHCIYGYYRTQPSYPEVRGHCQPCTKCQFPKRPCHIYNDTVCCRGDDYVVIINKTGHPVCVRECGPGHFLDSANDQCLSCPPSSYMTERKHINQFCKTCEFPKSQKEKIVRTCNATHPTVIDCIDGYSRQFSDMEQPDHGECVKICGRGQYLDPAAETCRPCHQNTYMDEDRHSNAYKCKTCSTPKASNEKIVQPCNSTHPAVIGCVEGFYRRLSEDLTTSTCAPCRYCSENTDGNVYEGRACGELSNSVCCPQPGMAVVEAHDGPICVMLLTKFTGSPVCGEGEYLSTTASGHSVTCLPCTQGTYMDKVQHTSTSCKSCTEFPIKRYCDYVTSSQKIDPKDGLGMETVVGLQVGLTFLFIVTQTVVYFVLKWWWRRHTSNTRGDDDGSESHLPLLQRRGSETVTQKRRTESESSSSGSQIRKIKQKEFIPITQFNNVHLSFQYCDDIMVHLIKLQAKLTTLINVTGSSDHRPKKIKFTDSPYPYSENRYRYEAHTGSGWVQWVKMYTDRSCPCKTCQLSVKPVKQWGEIVICTATRIVFDIREAKTCKCYFFYQNDNIDLLSCPSLSDALKVLSDVDRDWCYMTFVTHNWELTQELHDHFTRYHRLRREVQHKYGVVTDDTTYDELDSKLPQLHNRLEYSLNVLKKEREEIEKNPDSYLQSAKPDVVSNYGYRLQDQSSSFGVLLDLTTADQENGNTSQKLLCMLSTLQRNYSRYLEEVRDLKRQLQLSNVKDEGLAVDKYRELCRKEDRLNKFLRCLILNLGTGKNVASHTEYPPRFSSDHTLTVIVSHPLGGSQQVSLGDVVDISHLWYDHHSMYRYTNKTCEGCEGARVFILGRKGLSDHSHSGTVDGEGESGAWSDIIPYTVNLSAIPEEN